MADTERKPQPTTTNDPMPFDERTRRVLELRRQIREGTYRPDPRAIAEALLEEWSWHDAGSSETPAAGVNVRAMAGRFIVPPAGASGQESAPDARTA
jgi:hypothetical protein